jgi:chromosome segregation ATPase
MEPITTLISSPPLLALLENSNSTKSACLTLIDNPLSPSSNSLESTSLQTLQSQLSALRGQHRKTISAIRATKQSTADARAEVDQLHLHLQNLLYEQSHLRNEIEACESYEYVHMVFVF